MLGEVGSACGRHRYEGANAHSMLLGNEPSRIGVFPDGKPRARGAPGLNDLTIRSRAWANPLQQVKYQSIDGIKHKSRAVARATILYIQLARDSRANYHAGKQ